MERWFSHIIQDIESIVLGYANGNEATVISTTIKTYLQDFDFERLEVQFSIIPDVNGTAFLL